MSRSRCRLLHGTLAKPHGDFLRASILRGVDGKHGTLCNVLGMQHSLRNKPLGLRSCLHTVKCCCQSELHIPGTMPADLEQVPTCADCCRVDEDYLDVVISQCLQATLSDQKARSDHLMRRCENVEPQNQVQQCLRGASGRQEANSKKEEHTA